MGLLEIKDLHVSIEGKEILKGLNLKLELGKINALMGPNGSGKSTLANTLMGHPKYEVTRGSILYNGEDITTLGADERARKGLFLSFQYPYEIPGVTISNFLRSALNARREEGDKMSVMEFKKILDEKMALLKVDSKFLTRYLNQGFSGGEKKRSEILQLTILDPTFAILDETDSGLDIDALRIVAEGVNKFMGPKKCVLIITHYKRILEYIKPDKLFIMIDGKIVSEGTAELVDHLEEKGYEWIERE